MISKFQNLPTLFEILQLHVSLKMDHYVRKRFTNILQILKVSMESVLHS